MNNEQLIKSLEALNKRQKPELYNINEFKVWNKLNNVLFEKNKGSVWTGDIWNDGEYIWKIECYSQLIKDLQPSVIFETGFNIGRSACMFLNQAKKYINKPIKFYSNDIEERSLTNVKLLQEEFDNFNFLLGDSKILLPTYLKENNIKIDFALVDGEHSYNGAKTDCINFKPYINEGGIIFVDDWWIEDVARGALEAGWGGWTIYQVPKYERGAVIFLKDGGKGEVKKLNTIPTVGLLNF